MKELITILTTIAVMGLIFISIDMFVSGEEMISNSLGTYLAATHAMCFYLLIYFIYKYIDKNWKK